MTRFTRSGLLACAVLAATLAVLPSAHAAFVNHPAREINVKIVYYGPPLAGQAAAVQYLYEHTPPEARGKLIHLGSDRTSFFDFVPPTLGEIRGFKVRFHVYALDAPVEDPAAARPMLKGADAIVLVVDARKPRAEGAAPALEGLKRNLKELGHDIEGVPLVIQLDEGARPGAAAVENVKKALAQAWPGVVTRPFMPADASTGVGIFDVLKAIAKLSVMELRKPPPAEKPAEKPAGKPAGKPAEKSAPGVR